MDEHASRFLPLTNMEGGGGWKTYWRWLSVGTALKITPWGKPLLKLFVWNFMHYFTSTPIYSLNTCCPLRLRRCNGIRQWNIRQCTANHVLLSTRHPRGCRERCQGRCIGQPCHVDRRGDLLRFRGEDGSALPLPPAARQRRSESGSLLRRPRGEQCLPLSTFWVGRDDWIPHQLSTGVRQSIDRCLNCQSFYINTQKYANHG